MHNEIVQEDYSYTPRRQTSSYQNRRVCSRERKYEDDDRNNSYNQYDDYERGECNREEANNTYFNKRRSEEYYNIRAPSSFQRRGGAEFHNGRCTNRNQVRGNYERRPDEDQEER